MCNQTRTAFIPLIILVAALIASTQQASAFASDDAKRCRAFIDVPVPKFKCSDGVEVPKIIDSQGHCDKPEDLNARCVFHSRLGRLTSPNSNVDIVFSCRKKVLIGPDEDPTHQNDTSANYQDIAIIQHDRETGATCFYQAYGDLDGDNLPAPGSPEAVTTAFWNYDYQKCSWCHTNGPFIRTPHYNSVLMKDASGRDVPVLPDINKINHYAIVNKSITNQIVDVAKEGNLCNRCHNIGGYRRPNQQAVTIGKINELASGTIKAIDEQSSPTTTGYDDFMRKHVMFPGEEPEATRRRMVAAINDLKTCLLPPRAPGCTITHTFTQQYLHGPGLRFRTRNLNLGNGADFIEANKGQRLYASLSINHDCKSCGGAINQIIVGIEGEDNAQACIWSGGQTSGGWRENIRFSLTAPQRTGPHSVRVRYAQAFNCATALRWWKVDMPNGPDDHHTIGTIYVNP